MKDLLIRSFTGIFFGIIFILAIYYGKYSFIPVCFLIVLLGLHEFYRFSEKGNSNPIKYLGIIAGSVFFLINSLYLHRIVPVKFLIISIPLIFLLFIYVLFSKSENPLINISVTLAGIFYVAFPFTLLNYLAYPPPPYPGYELFKYNPNVILGFFFFDMGQRLCGISHRCSLRQAPAI